MTYDSSATTTRFHAAVDPVRLQHDRLGRYLVEIEWREMDECIRELAEIGAALQSHASFMDATF